MQSDYERNRYRKRYIIISLIFLFCIGIWSVLIFQGLTWKVAGSMLIFLAFSIVIYAVSYHNLDSAYSEMENISGIMIDIIEERDEPMIDSCKEGSVGILYSNFDKMVQTLKKSKNRERQEKIFLRDIISDISHQLKTPLASLNVFVDLLLEEKVTEPEERKKILKESANQLNRMEWMVLAMLKLARIEAGAIQFEKKETPLKPLLAEAAEGVKFLVNDRRQSLTLDCEKEITLLCDADWLVEAVINLLKNASDYSENGKSIWVEVEQTNVYTRIYVKDEGAGIAEHEIPNIFKRFYRVHQEVNPNSVGIGLSLTKSIIEGMGGSIHVKSEEGKYTWFILTFVN